MLKNYLKIACRTLWKQKGYTFINISGLAVGMASCILIALYVRDELSYDNFHKQADRIVFVGSEWTHGGNSRESMATPYPLAGALERELPSVEKAVRTLWPSPEEISRDGKTFIEEDGVLHVGAGFFEVFTFPLIEGNLRGTFNEPNTAVISEELAQKHFPNENPIGQILHIKERGEHTYRIIGVARIPGKSYLDFNAVLSLSTLDYADSHGDSWLTSRFLTFARLQAETSTTVFREQAAQLAEKRVGAALGDRASLRYFVQPMTGLYLSDLVSADGFRGTWRYIYIFSTIAAFILLIACINYTNLATARSMRRGREVGIRKTVGAGRGQVAGQFLGESVLLSFSAFLVGLLLAEAALPFFNYLVGKDLALSVEANGGFLLVLGGTALAVGLLAGSYPALYLSAFRPASVLRGQARPGPSSAWLREGLVVVQFAIAVVLIVSTAVIYRQLLYTQQKDLGFSGEQVVTTDVPGEGHEALRGEVLAHPGVTAASITNGVPGEFRVSLGRQPQNVSSQTRADTSQTIRFHPAIVDYHYVETLELELLAGRNFSRERSSDSQRGYIINETAAEQMGWTSKEAVGKPFDLGGPGEVIGVVEDFHIASLHQQIEPVVLQMHESESWSSSLSLAARLVPGTVQDGLRHIEKQRARFSDEPFEYVFLDDEFAQLYQTERRLGQVFASFAGFAIFIACLGLLGLAAHAAEQRTKEIGIRKVLGATVSNIVALLSKDFLKLVAVAMIVAVPIAYYGMNRWLQDFAYRIDLGPWVFLLAGLITVGVAFLTISYQSIKAALTNPAESLRYE